MPVSAGRGTQRELDARAGVQADAGRRDRRLERALLQHAMHPRLRRASASADAVCSGSAAYAWHRPRSARDDRRSTRRHRRVAMPEPPSVRLLAQERRDVGRVERGADDGRGALGAGA